MKNIIEILKLLFNPEGRINKKIFILIIALNIAFLIFLFYLLSGLKNRFVIDIIALFIITIFLFIGIIAIIKRLHDLDKSGFYIFILILPFHNLILLFHLFLSKGSTTKNRFGENSLLNNKNNKSDSTFENINK